MSSIVSPSPSSLPEILVFYLDLITKIVSKKDLGKILQRFLEEKRRLNAHVSFFAFYFKQDAAPFLTEELTDVRTLVRYITHDWKKHDTRESKFENGLFYCLSVIGEKAVNMAGHFRVIVISDTPSMKSSDYAEALMNLVETVRRFPTYVDIIRVGEHERYTDDVKLRVITSITNGGLFYISSAQEFQGIMLGMARNKALPMVIGVGDRISDEEAQLYFEHIAQKSKPIPQMTQNCVLCGQMECSFCGEKADALKCPHCNNEMHECCIAQYSWQTNVSFRHITRCVKCGYLLKLDEARVKQINEGVHVLKKVSKSTKGTKSEKGGKGVKSLEETKEPPSEEIWTPTEKKSSTKAKPKKSVVKEMPPKEEALDRPSPPQIKPVKATSELKTITTIQRRSPSTVKFCTICSTPIKGNLKKCPKCGANLA